MLPDPGLPQAPFEVPTQEVVGIQAAAIEIVKDGPWQMLGLVPEVLVHQPTAVVRLSFEPFLDLGTAICTECVEEFVRDRNMPDLVTLRRAQLFEVAVPCASDDEFAFAPVHVWPLEREGLPDPQARMDEGQEKGHMLP
jgi:hypothetical protein